MSHKFKVVLPRVASGAVVEMDGKPLLVKSIAIKAAVGEATSVIVEFPAVTVEVECDGELIDITTVSDETKRLLR